MKLPTRLAIALMDEARQLGLTVQLRASRTSGSNSRYLYMNDNRVIRVSDHRAVVERTALNLVIRTPAEYERARRTGLQWIQDNYAA